MVQFGNSAKRSRLEILRAWKSAGSTSGSIWCEPRNGTFLTTPRATGERGADDFLTCHNSSSDPGRLESFSGRVFASRIIRLGTDRAVGKWFGRVPGAMG